MPAHRCRSGDQASNGRRSQVPRPLQHRTGGTHETKKREQGRIKFWNQDKGFGFVRTDDGDDNSSLHVSNFGFLSAERLAIEVAFERGVNPRTNRPEVKSASILDEVEKS